MTTPPTKKKNINMASKTTISTLFEWSCDRIIWIQNLNYFFFSTHDNQ